MRSLALSIVLLVGCAEMETRRNEAPEQPEVYVGMTSEELVIKRAASPSGKQGDKLIYKYISPSAKACTGYFKQDRLIALPYCVDTPESIARDRNDQDMAAAMLERRPPSMINSFAPPPTSAKTHCKTSKDGFGNLITDCE